MRSYAVAVLVAVAAVCTGCADASRGEGPLAASANATSAGISGTGGYVGSVFSTGLVTLTNPSRDPLVLDAVELLGGRGGLELVGAGIQRAPIEGVVGLGPGYPPEATTPIAPLRGAVVAPHEQNVSVVVGAKAVRAGADSFTWIRLAYHVAARRDHYEVDFPIGIDVCALRHAAAHAHCQRTQPGGSK